MNPLKTSLIFIAIVGLMVGRCNAEEWICEEPSCSLRDSGDKRPHIHDGHMIYFCDANNTGRCNGEEEWIHVFYDALGEWDFDVCPYIDMYYCIDGKKHEFEDYTNEARGILIHPTRKGVGASKCKKCGLVLTCDTGNDGYISRKDLNRLEKEDETHNIDSFMPSFAE